jgi:hypothetical protein
MDIITLVIDETGSINKTRLLDIHNKVKETISHDVLGMNYGFYIVRVFNFLKSFLKSGESRTLLDIFQQDIMIFP